MTDAEEELYIRAMIAALNADRFGFIETARAMREIARQIRSEQSIFEDSPRLKNYNLMFLDSKN